MKNIASKLTIGTFIIAFVLVLIALAADFTLGQALIFGIGIAAAMVPQGLPAQITVALGHLVSDLLFDPVLLDKLIQHFESLTPSERDRPAASDQLLGLNKKLDFANTTAAEFDIVPRYGKLGIPFVCLKLTLDRMNIGDRCEIEIAPPDERPEFFEKGFTELDIAGNRA